MIFTRFSELTLYVSLRRKGALRDLSLLNRCLSMKLWLYIDPFSDICFILLIKDPFSKLTSNSLSANYRIQLTQPIFSHKRVLNDSFIWLIVISLIYSCFKIIVEIFFLPFCALDYFLSERIENIFVDFDLHSCEGGDSILKVYGSALSTILRCGSSLILSRFFLCKL